MPPPTGFRNYSRALFHKDVAPTALRICDARATVYSQRRRRDLFVETNPKILKPRRGRHNQPMFSDVGNAQPPGEGRGEGGRKTRVHLDAATNNRVLRFPLPTTQC